MAERPPPLVLAYHGIGEVPLGSDPNGLFVRPQDFLRQVAKLHAWGYRLLTFGELAERVPGGDAEGCAALTFDDGLADNLEALVPLLEKVGAPATVFVVSGWLGQHHRSAPWARMLTEDELRGLRAAGVEVGAHTATHPDLTRLSKDEAHGELARSKSELEEVLGEPVRVAAYPYGRANEETVAACREAGFDAACRAGGAGSWDDPHALPREDMENASSLLGLRLKRDGRYEPLMRRLPVRAARRVARRARSLAR
jgi:peptidoglycan/xylan/chitin deacetylase (PgdA/CDA1 family)